jgi:signal transduction histidine kinase
MTTMPLVHDGEAIGALSVVRLAPGPLSEKQLAVLKTFTGQAVIAIENARLFDEVQARTRELTEALQQQTATADVLKVISRSTFDLTAVLQTLVESAARLCDADKATIIRQKGGVFFRAEAYGFSREFIDYVRTVPVEPGRGSATGRALLEGKVIHIPDVQADPDYTWAEAQKLGGFRTILGVPMLREGVPIGVLALTRDEVRPFTDKQIELVTTFADQAAIAIENVRLFEEIQDKSRQLAEASKHKSQFLANMSHELRTPLNAILGYTELILDNIYGDVPDKARTTLERVQSNGKHLLALINDVLDLSKIEAGQLTLALTDYALKDVVLSVFSAVEPLAREKELALAIEVAPDLPTGRGDERRLTQVLLNLVGNAIKFTDQGEVVIKASAQNGSFTVAVRDTGLGIGPADQAKIFEEFRQADSSLTRKKGGTGLGLSISRRIVEMHGGRLWVESEVECGSTFAFMLPVNVERQVGSS